MVFKNLSLKSGFFGLVWGKPKTVEAQTNSFSSLAKYSQQMLTKMAFVTLEELQQEAFLDILPYLENSAEGYSYFVSKQRGGFSTLQDKGHSLYDVLISHLEIERKRRTESVGGSLHDIKHQKTPLGTLEAFWVPLLKSKCKPTPKDLKLFVKDKDVWELYLKVSQEEGNINTAMADTIISHPTIDFSVFSSRVNAWISHGGDITWKDNGTGAGMGHLCFLNYSGGDIASAIYMVRGLLDNGLADTGPTKVCKSVYTLIQEAIERTSGVKFINLPTVCQQTILTLEAMEHKALLKASLSECLERKTPSTKGSRKM